MLGSLLARAQGPPNSITFPAKGDTANRVKDRWTVQIMGRTPYWVPPLGSPYSAFPVRGELNSSLGEIGLVGPIQFDQFYDQTLSGSPTDSVKGLGVDLQKELERIRQVISIYAPSAGKDGRDGVNGKDGAPGATGPVGATGGQGIQGLPGVAGKDGKDGSPGSNGVDGAPGTQGVQGVPGKDGKDGAAGSNGISAYTQTSSAYTNPAVGSSVNVSVGTTAWMSKGQYVYVFNVGTGSQAGVYLVSNVNSLTSVNLTYTSDLPFFSGTVVGGSYMTPTGLRGAAGAAGTQITSSSSLTVSSVFVDTPASSDSARTVATTGWVKAYNQTVSGPWSRSGTAAYYSGPVGVGTSTPKKLFDVAGAGVFTTLHIRGVDDAETNANTLENAPGSGLRIRGGFIHSYNAIRHEGNGNFLTDGNFLLRALGRSDRAIFVNAGGISVGNGTTDATATLDVTGTFKASGNVTIGASLTTTGSIKAAGIILADNKQITDFGPGNGIDYGGNGRFHLKNDAVITLMENQLRSYDGYDATVSKVLSTTGSSFRWIVPPTSTSGTSGTTAAPMSTSAMSTAYRDSVLINADSTKMRFSASGTTTTNISTVAQLRTFLTTTQTNVRGVLANGTYDDGKAFEQTGTWTNVSLEAANFRQAILSNSGGNLVWINQGSNSRRRVRLKDFVLRTGALDQNSLAIFHHNELPDWDGLELDGIELYHTNPTQGKTNGLTLVPYSEGSSQGKVLKNLFIHNSYFHDIPRANEILSHGFDADRVLNVVVTNNKFERFGLNDDFGSPLSYSGRIKYIYTAKNIFDGFKYGGIEHVANRFAIDANNVISNTATTGGVGIAMSDNNLNLSRYLWLENNTINVMSRPFYAYGVKNLFVSGGSLTGRLGIDGTPKSSIFKDFTVTVWAKANQSVYNYVWQFDGDSNDNDVINVTASSGGTQANSPGGPTAYTIHLMSNTYNNRLNNVTTILGKDANGNWGGSGAIINDGANTNVITNNTVSRVN